MIFTLDLRRHAMEPSEVRKIAAMLVSLDKNLVYLQNSEDERILEKIDYAQSFVPSVIHQWLERHREMTLKQLSAIRNMYNRFDQDDMIQEDLDYEVYLDHEKVLACPHSMK